MAKVYLWQKFTLDHLWQLCIGDMFEQKKQGKMYKSLADLYRSAKKSLKMYKKC